MKRIHVIDGKVDVVEWNVDAEPSNTHPFVVDDSVEVFGGYASNGDGTFTAPPKPTPTNDDVTAERNRRTDLPVTINTSTGKSFQADVAKGGRANIGDMALLAVVKNSLGDTSTFTFRDASNVNQTLSNDEVIEMGVQAAAQYDAIYKKSWALKDTDPIPQDYTDDSYWN